MKLSDILLEIKSDQQIQSTIDNVGAQLDDIFKDELEKASKQQNEAILTTLALVLAIPGFLKSVAKIAETIATKTGISVEKDKTAWYKILEKFADKIDDYIETPFNIILKPVIKDDVKRKKIVKFIKGACIIAMAIIGSVDLNQAPTITAKIKSISGEFAKELTQNAIEKNLGTFTEFAKKTIQNIINS